MCGIAGILDPTASTSADRLGALASSMASASEHRGPDDDGVWVDADAGVAFGHRRLAVIDLGMGGAQPMVSSGRPMGDGLQRRDLQPSRGPASIGRWRGRSFEAIPTPRCCSRRSSAGGSIGRSTPAKGCSPSALWDRRDRELHLVRDRFGEKPLYYGWVGKVFAFGSELKALSALAGIRSAELDRRAVTRYLRHNCVPAPDTIWRGVRKLLPGHLVTLRSPTPGVLPSNAVIGPWPTRWTRARQDRLTGSDAEMTDQLEDALSQRWPPGWLPTCRWERSFRGESTRARSWR